MTRKLYVGLSVFFGLWLSAHLFYAFSTLTWVPFTEWGSLSRGVVLAWTLYHSAMAAWCVEGDEH